MKFFVVDDGERHVELTTFKDRLVFERDGAIDPSLAFHSTMFSPSSVKAIGRSRRVEALTTGYQNFRRTGCLVTIMVRLDADGCAGEATHVPRGGQAAYMAHGLLPWC